MNEEQRSYIMSKIRSKGTKPEIAVRKFLHAKGFRFRLHNKNLPGKPDLVLPKYKATIFVHGCFWHHHSHNCKIAHIPKTRQDYWIPKIQKNINRFRNQEKELAILGYKVIVVWECEIKNKFDKTMENVISALLQS
ncbi:very short patch repair endonuclease [Parafilimonas sp.]|uniref:very short patch repair endonuclease n=1 Tax=Parafilimonas sp. TaxID=1969739 RepID=UPI0039E710F0